MDEGGICYTCLYPLNLFLKDFNVKKLAKRDSQLLRKEVKKLNVIL